ncbi:MAG: hypothetical protein WBE58_08560, partial [Verrucomicrobiales bacterium]
AAKIYANSKLVSDSVIPEEEGDGGVDVITGLVRALQFDYRSTDGQTGISSGDVVEVPAGTTGDPATFFRFLGGEDEDISLGAEDFSDISRWEEIVVAAGDEEPEADYQTDQVGVPLFFGDVVVVVEGHEAGGEAGRSYRYMGASQSDDGLRQADLVDLGAEDFSNQDLWQLVKTDDVTSSAMALFADGEEDQKTEDAGGDPKAASSTSVGILVVRNDAITGAKAYIQDIALDGVNVTVSALENLTFSAETDSQVKATGGTAQAGGDLKSDSMAINGVISTNTVQASAEAHILRGSIVVGSDLTVNAENTSIVEATTNAAVEGDGTSVGVVLAFNTLGYESQNILFSALDALLGTNIGNENPARVEAYVQDANITAGGDVTVSGSNEASLSATLGNAASSAATADGISASGLLGLNRVRSEAQAWVDYTGARGTIDAGGAVTVSASDNASLEATLEVSAITSIVEDPKDPDPKKTLAASFVNSYDYTTESGLRTIALGDSVYVGSEHEPSKGAPGRIYIFTGLTPVTVDLATVDYFSDPGWTLQTITNAVTDQVLDSLFPAPDPADPPETPGQTAAGVTVVRNELASGAVASIHNATLTVGTLIVKADETSTFRSEATGEVESAGGGTVSAFNGLAATNSLISTAEGRHLQEKGAAVAELYNADVTTTGDPGEEVDAEAGIMGGDVSVTASNQASFDATNDLSTTSSGGGAVGVVLAFNTVGYESQNILFATIDALLGTNIGNQHSSRAVAFIENVPVDASGGVTVVAENEIGLNATLSNATSGADGNFSGSFAIASNMVSGGAEAWIKSTGGGTRPVSAGGGITVSANDAAKIYANSKLTSATTLDSEGDGGVDLVTGVVRAFSFDYLSTDGEVPLRHGMDVLVGDEHTAGGEAGKVYSWMGDWETVTVNLSEEDFSNTDYWRRVTTTDVLEALNVPGMFGSETEEEKAAGGGGGATSIGGLIVRNDVISRADATIEDIVLNAAFVGVAAMETSIFSAITDNTASTGGDEPAGATDSLAVGGIIATNTVQSGADAHILRGSVTTTDGDVSVTAENTAEVTAETRNAVSTGGKSIGAVLAFNTLGFESQNVLFNALDALVGSDIGNENPSEVLAYIQDAAINSAGDVNVIALNAASLESTLSNDASATSEEGDTMAIAGVLASNMVSSGSRAWIDFAGTTPGTRGTVNAGGKVTVEASDETVLSGDSSFSASSTKFEKDDPSVLSTLAQTLSDSYGFTTKSGVQTVHLGSGVLVDSEYDPFQGDRGKIYRYVGLLSEPLDLGTIDYKHSADWVLKTTDNVLTDDFIAIFKDSGAEEDDTQNTTAAGGLIVRNELRGNGARAFVDHANINVSEVRIAAAEDTTLIAISSGVVESSGDSSIPAVNGVVATNTLQGSAEAYLTNSVLTTTSGDAEVEATNSAKMDATNTTSLTGGGGKSFGLSVAFNKIGYEPQNLLFDAIDALVGTNIVDADPSRARAYIEDTTITVAGDLSVIATNSTRFNATLTNTSSSGGTSVGGALANNMVNTGAEAWIGTSDNTI